MAPVNVVYLMICVTPFYDSIHLTIFEEVWPVEYFNCIKAIEYNPS